MRSVAILVVLVGWLAGSLCGCADTDPPAMRTLVTVIATEEGQPAKDATERLVTYGRRSLVVIEAALHTADPAGRKRLLRAIKRLGDKDAIALVAHVAKYDEDEDVRKEATDTLAALAR